PDSNIEILVKLESYNPGGSIKDRIAKNMIEKAEKNGKLKPGGTIVEPTSGNTGIGLAVIGAERDYNVILVMPETMSIERRSLLKAFGADLILTPGKQGMKGAINKAEELINNNKSYFMPRQFDNQANPEAHIKYTAQEIINDIDGKIDFFTAGVGTGGTITGIGSELKKLNNNTKIVAVEPEKSAVLSGQNPGPHKIQGIGAGFIPNILDKSIIDRIITIDNNEAYETTREIAKNEGLLFGISAGANIKSAIKLAKELKEKGKKGKIVTVAPDSGERYLSDDLF
ncbi:MAG TPA: cysteine synthase A, partial [Halanaerobiales bacterium]|nr:cysteine synthase A [Halanaerobiales bacterium]